MWFNGMKRGLHLVLVTLAALAVIGSCSKPKEPEASAQSPQPAASVSKPDASSKVQDPAANAYACTLLTAEEIAAVQGEPFKATRPSSGPGPGLSVSQCYFELPLAVNSVVLTVTRKSDATGARDPKEQWQEIFHGERRAEKEEKEGEEKGPEKIEGLGDEAFWTGTRIGGALYVLKGSVYFRISVGGAGDQAEKIRRSKALAENILKRL
jgi:hypothetical protein